MAKEDSQVDPKCQAELHDQHLCYLMSQGFHLSDAEEYNDLTDDPRFRCDHCGREANGGQNMCVPVDLESMRDSSSSAPIPPDNE